MHVTLYSDGSSLGNPGPGGYGTILEYISPTGEVHTREYTYGYRMTTNNRMELRGVIAGLKQLTKPCDVDVYTDSQYVVNMFEKHWVEGWQKKGWKNSKREPVKNRDLIEELMEAMAPHKVSYHWIKGHAGHPQNERCDLLARTSAEGENLLTDEGYVPEEA